MAAQLDETVRIDRDLAFSRVLCPASSSRTAPTTHSWYFETGRLAGLGKDPSLAPFATESASSNYAGREDPDLFPYYHRWYFRTGSVGDFEYLVG